MNLNDDFIDREKVFCYSKSLAKMNKIYSLKNFKSNIIYSIVFTLIAGLVCLIYFKARIEVTIITSLFVFFTFFFSIVIYNILNLKSNYKKWEAWIKNGKLHLYMFEYGSRAGRGNKTLVVFDKIDNYQETEGSYIVNGLLKFYIFEASNKKMEFSESDKLISNFQRSQIIIPKIFEGLDEYMKSYTLV